MGTGAMQAAFLNTLIKADSTILRTLIWHSGHLRFVFWSGQEAASVIVVTERHIGRNSG
jgi:hypothetical protein